MSTPTRLLPSGAREEYVTALGGRFRVLRGEADNDNIPILLIHGGASDNAAISWYRLIEPLSHDRPVIAPDLAGFGYTEGVPSSDTAAGMADQLRDLLDVLGVDRVAVCGVSMGGEVAVRFAMRHPRRTASLIAIAPGGFIRRYKNSFAHSLVWAATTIPDAVLNPLANFANRFVTSVLKRMVYDTTTVPDAVIEEFAREARRPGSTRAYGRYNKASIGRRRMLNNILDMPELSQIDVPTLFFHGEFDPMVAPEGSREAAARIPGARLVMMCDCGHWAQLEAHDRFLTELRSLLTEARN